MDIFAMTQEDENLTAFISNVDNLYRLAHGGKSIETGFDTHFQKLKQLSVDLSRSKEEAHLSLVGRKPENKKKNRYKDITPFDSTRVTLTSAWDNPNSDYINASFIRGAFGNQRYIASQGPLPHTVLDFWQMLWQYNVSTIVMVCREVELGKKKCERYWAGLRETKNFGEITVTLCSEEELKGSYRLRTIDVQKGDESRTIYQFHYTSWPDHGVPKTCFEIITLVNHVRDVHSYRQDEISPLCVHCSAGCGRTGAVLAVDYVRNLLERKSVPDGLSMYEIVADMRRQRPAIVQTKEQYEFVNAAISELFRVYLQTRTVSYKEFDVGYQGEQYVNVNIRVEHKPKDKGNGAKSQSRPSAQSYENVNLQSHLKEDTNLSLQGGTRPDTTQDYPTKSPPATPTMTQSSLTPLVDSRKQCTPAVLSQKLVPVPSANSPHSGNSKTAVNSWNPNLSNRNQTNSLTFTGRPRTKPQPPVKPILKPEPAARKISTQISPVSGGDAAAKSNVSTKPNTQEGKITPVKPQRLISHNPVRKTFSYDTPHSLSANKGNPKNFQKFTKNHLYSDIVLNDNDGVQAVAVDPEYAELKNPVSMPRTSSDTSMDQSSSLFPPLPARTPEAQILLDHSPPALPTRTAESYLTLQVEDDLSATYRAAGANTLPANSAALKDMGAFMLSPSPKHTVETSRRSGSNSTSTGTRSLTAKVKKKFGNTSNPLSKLGAALTKSASDDNTRSPPATENRAPAFMPSPVVHSGQDISFNKRLQRKVKGGRKPK